MREIASRIGLHEDSEILQTVCHKMREEYVVELWQLPALDSWQWDKLHAPVGLAVAVQRLSSSTASSLARSTSLASLLRLSHERDQQKQGSQASSIFRLNKDHRSSSSSSSQDEGTAPVREIDAREEDEAVAAILANLPSELPPLVLKKSTSGSSSFDDGLQDAESRVERNDSKHSNRLSLSAVIRDGCEPAVRDVRVQGGKWDESEIEESSNILLKLERGEHALLACEQTDSSESFSDEILEICLADSDPEEEILTQVKCESNDNLDISLVDDQEAERVNISATASPTTTATTLAPTPEKLSRSGNSDSILWVDKMLSRPGPSSPTLTSSTEASLDSSHITSADTRFDITSSAVEGHFLDLPNTDVDERRKSFEELLLLAQNCAENNSEDDTTVVVSNVSPEGQAIALRRTRSELYNRPAVEGTSRRLGSIVGCGGCFCQFYANDRLFVLSLRVRRQKWQRHRPMKPKRLNCKRF